jgi:predicted enzyme related to lactoylglutathione lyase
MSTSEKKQAASIIWFEIPADNPERANAFYTNLFGWKINPFPGGGDYWHIDTGGADDTPDGALKGRKQPGEPIVNYISVDSVAEFSKKIAKHGGKICMAQTAVPPLG